MNPAKVMKLDNRWPEPETYTSLDLLIGALASETAAASQRWVYRGQARASWSLQPTLERRRPLESLRTSESLLLSDFKRHARSLSDRLPEYDDIPSWLSLMRHHSVPTRLLDWTDSPIVAIFFACDERNDCDNGDPEDPYAAIWALNSTRLIEKFNELASKVIPKVLGEHDRKKIDVDLSNPRRFEHLAFYAFDDDPPNPNPHREDGLVGELMPRSSNSRMSFQQGTFLISCNHHLPFETSIRAMMMGPHSPDRTWIRKVRFPYVLRDSVLKRLYGTNTHPFTLFPDLDGLGRLLKLKNDLYWSTRE